MAGRPGWGGSYTGPCIDGGSHAGHPIPQGGCEAGEGLDAARNMDARGGDHRGQRTPARLMESGGAGHSQPPSTARYARGAIGKSQDCEPSYSRRSARSKT